MEAAELKRFLDDMRGVLDAQGIVLDDDASAFTRDIIGEGAAAVLVARPTSTQQVADVVKTCAAYGVAIVPQGGNTNVCRMAIPLPGQDAIVLSLARMTQILEINADAYTATVEAGVLMQTLQDAALETNRTFAPDWGARGTATLGGAVATNGGGLNVLRYGTTREQVLGIEAVLPDGTIWNGLRSLIKDNSGYDLKHLFIGSEGTLGIITKIVFKLHPAQPVTQSMMAVLADMDQLPRFFDTARQIGGDNLVAFELMPSLGVEKALERYPDLQRPLDTRADWYLLVRMAGTTSVDALMMQIFEAGFEQGILQDAVLSNSMAQEANLWEIREQMIPHQYFDIPMLKWDVSMPLDRIITFLAQAKEILAQIAPDAIPYAVGHVGDGNIHYSAFVPTETSGTKKDDIYQAIDSLIWKMNGSIVAEHGVGAIFVDRMRRQKSDVEYRMMQSIKMAIDPQGMMNPGKLLALAP